MRLYLMFVTAVCVLSIREFKIYDGDGRRKRHLKI